MRKGEKMCIPISFEMKWIGLVEAINEAHNAEEQDAEEEQKETKEEDEFEEEGEDEGHPFEWFCDVSDATTQGRSVLVSISVYQLQLTLLN